MNKDHADDMSAILRYFVGLDGGQAARPEMLDLDLATLTVRSASGVHAVLLAPPMAAWGDRRGRLADMTVEARRALGLEVAAEEGKGEAGTGTGPATAAGPVRFYPPEGVGLVSFAGVMWYFVSAAFYFSGNIVPGSLFWRFLEAIHFPGGPQLYAWLVKIILVPMIAIHLFEAFHVMANKRLAARGVPVGSPVWLLWTGCTFFEGAPAWQRWDRRVLGKQKKDQ